MNRTFIAAAAAAIAFAAVSIFTVAPAVANNDWASAADNPGNGSPNMASGPDGQQKVESRALSGCSGDTPGNSGCVIIASSPQCVAIAVSPSSGFTEVAGGSGATAQAAANAAVAALKKKGFSDGTAEAGTVCAWDPQS